MSMALQEPKVSVILPTYNRAETLGRAIKSVLDQTFGDFELIIVDDGSTDNTAEVVNSFRDPRVRYVRLETNRGAAAARNMGIKLARGDYIAFQDSDDEWLPEKLAKQMKVFAHAPAEVGVVYTGFWRIEGSKRTYIPSATVRRKEGNIHKELLKGNFVTTQAAVVKMECFDRAGLLAEELPRLQDWELFIRLSKLYEFRCVDEPLLIAYFTPDSISANRAALITALQFIIDRHFDDFKRHKGLLARWQYAIGNILCQAGETARGRAYLFKAAKSQPFNIKYVAAAVLSLVGNEAYTKAAEWKRKVRGSRALLGGFHSK